MTSNKFGMVCKVDRNPQLDSRDGSMYSSILKRPGNSIFIKSNIKLFVQFTNGNLSRKFLWHGTFFFNHMKEMEPNHNGAKRQVKASARFFYSDLKFTAIHCLK